MQHKVDNRWLPEVIHNHKWFDLDDITALEVGDWVFDPNNSAHYAGYIVKIDHDLFLIEWHKSIENVFNDLVRSVNMSKFWWLDSIMQ